MREVKGRTNAGVCHRVQCSKQLQRYHSFSGWLSAIPQQLHLSMGQQQQQPPTQRLNPVVDAAKAMGATAAPNLMHRSSYSLDDASSTCLAKQASSRLLLNPWRELTPSDFVIGYARGVGRVRCSTCLSKITQGELQVRKAGRARLAVALYTFLLFAFRFYFALCTAHATEQQTTCCACSTPAHASTVKSPTLEDDLVTTPP